MEPIRRAFRGYEPAQVDGMLETLRAQAAGLQRELDEQKNEHARLRSESEALRAETARAQESESLVQEALVSAHRQAEEILSEARREAETLLQVAREAAARYQDDLRGRINDLNWQIERLTLRKQQFVGSFRSILERHLAELAEPEAAGALAPAVVEVAEPLAEPAAPAEAP